MCKDPRQHSPCNWFPNSIQVQETRSNLTNPGRCELVVDQHPLQLLWHSLGFFPCRGVLPGLRTSQRDGCAARPAAAAPRSTSAASSPTGAGSGSASALPSPPPSILPLCLRPTPPAPLSPPFVPAPELLVKRRRPGRLGRQAGVRQAKQADDASTVGLSRRPSTRQGQKTSRQHARQ